MKYKSLLLLAICTFFCLIVTSCSNPSNFTVKGIVSDGSGQMLYLENVGVSDVSTLDSVKLTASGRFDFQEARPAFPEFYRLRLNNQLINFSIDSTETVSFVADAGTFATSYTVEGSESSKAIKTISLAQLDANLDLNRLKKEFENGEIEDTTYRRAVLDVVDAYKAIARSYIYTVPMSPVSYFALFQQIDGLLFFDLYDRDDSKAYSAVATSYNHFYPESPRSKHLYNLALQSIKVVRSQNPINFDDIEAKEVDFIDIELPDLNNRNIKLSDVAEKSPVLLVFTAYQTEWAMDLNSILLNLYDKYQTKGLKIYQVSLDTDLHLWKNVASALPWTCVYDPQSVYSPTASIYNVRQLPTFFILDKRGNLVKRLDDFRTLETDIKSVL